LAKNLLQLSKKNIRYICAPFVDADVDFCFELDLSVRSASLSRSLSSLSRSISAAAGASTVDMTKSEVIVLKKDIFQVNSRSGGEGKKRDNGLVQRWIDKTTIVHVYYVSAARHA